MPERRHMDVSRRWLPREGFVADVVGSVIKRTLLSPSLTVPLLLLATYTNKGREYWNSRPSALRVLKILVSLGLFRWVNRWLSDRALNNGVSDVYTWDREIAIVTGGSDGIGRKMAVMLAARGLKVAVLDIQPMKSDLPPNVKFYQCDICSPDQIADSAQKIRSEIGQPTILVNNAGILKATTILDTTESDVRKTFEVNTLSHYGLVREFLPYMVSRNHGMVVTVASLSSHVTAAKLVHYSASKAAALAFHEGLSVELKTLYQAPKVRTVAVTPSFIRTGLISGINLENTWLHPLLDPDTVVEAVVRQILTGSSGYIVLPGSTALPGSMIRAFPYWLQTGVRNRVERLTRAGGSK